MPLDVGGINYPIKLTGEFTKLDEFALKLKLVTDRLDKLSAKLAGLPAGNLPGFGGGGIGGGFSPTGPTIDSSSRRNQARAKKRAEDREKAEAAANKAVIDAAAAQKSLADFQAKLAQKKLKAAKLGPAAQAKADAAAEKAELARLAAEIAAQKRFAQARQIAAADEAKQLAAANRETLRLKLQGIKQQQMAERAAQKAQADTRFRNEQAVKAVLLKVQQGRLAGARLVQALEALPFKPSGFIQGAGAGRPDDALGFRTPPRLPAVPRQFSKAEVFEQFGAETRARIGFPTLGKLSGVEGKLAASRSFLEQQVRDYLAVPEQLFKRLGGVFLRDGKVFSSNLGATAAKLKSVQEALAARFEGFAGVVDPGGVFLRGGQVFNSRIQAASAKVRQVQEALAARFEGFAGVVDPGGVFLRGGNVFNSHLSAAAGRLRTVQEELTRRFEGFAGVVDPGGVFLRDGKVFSSNLGATAAKLKSVQEARFEEFAGVTEPGGLSQRGGRFFNSPTQAAAARLRQLQVPAVPLGMPPPPPPGLLRSLIGDLSEGHEQSELFRRSMEGLFRVFILFAGARAAIDVVKGLVTTMVEFNRQAERSRLGVATVITAVGTVRDVTGTVVKGGQALKLSLGLAEDQLAKLRQEALATSATFEQLSETFQIAIGPGLQAGLNLDEIRKFTVQISQAAQAIGLPQTQLAEEIRSILSGTVSLRTTRIAAVLGITNEDIRNAKEGGNLFGFLQKKFQAFTAAGEESLKTFDVIVRNTGAAFRLTAGTAEGSVRLFERLKKAVLAVRGLLVAGGDDGLLAPSPKAQEAFSAISDAIEGALALAQELIESLDLGTLASAAKTIGGVLGFVLRSAVVQTGAVAEGFTTALSVAEKIGERLGRFPVLLEAVELFVGNITALLGNMLGFMGGILAIAGPVAFQFLAWSLALRGIVGVGGLLVGQYAAMRLLLLNIAFAYFRITNAATAWLATTGATVVTLRSAALFLGRLTLVLGVLTAAFLIFEELTAGKDAGKTAFSGLSKELDALRGSVSGTPAGLKALDEQMERLAESTRKATDELAKARALFGLEGLARDEAGARFDSQLRVRDETMKLEKEILELEKQRTEVLKDQEDLARKKRQFTSGDVDAIDKVLRLEKQRTELERGLRGSDAKRSPELRAALEDFRERRRIIDLRASLKELGPGQATAEQRAALSALPILSPEASATFEEDLARQLDEVKAARGDDAKEQIKAELDVGAIRKRIEDVLAESQAGRLKITEQELATLKEQLDVIRLQAEEKRRVALASIQGGLESSLLTGRQDSALELADARRRLQAPALSNEFARQRQGIGLDLIAKRARLELDSLREQEAKQKEINELGLEAEVQERALGHAKLHINRILEDQLGLAEKLALASLGEVNKAQRFEAAQGIAEAIKNAADAVRKASKDVADAFKEGRDSIQSAADALFLQRNLGAAIFPAQQVDLAGAGRNLVNRGFGFQAVRDKAERARQLAVNVRTAEIEAGFRGRDRIQAREDAGETGAALEASKLVINGQISQELQLQVTALEEANALLEQQANKAASIAEIFASLSETLAESLADAFQGLIDGLAEALADTILDAIDPDKNGSFRERLAQVFKSIARALLQSAIAAVINTAVRTIAAGAGGGGFAEGGEVPNTPSALRPKGLAVSDTVPAWLTPGEHVMPVHAVQRYGMDALEALRRGMVDPAAFRSIAAGRSRRAIAVGVNRIGYAEGGAVGRGGSGAGAGGGAQPVLIADEKAMSRLLAGGKNAMVRFVRLHQAELKSALGRD